MRQLGIGLALVVVAGAVAGTQGSSYVLKTYAAGSATVVLSATIPATQVTCNQTAPPPVTVNPTRAFWDDTANAGKVCIWADPGTGPIRGVPAGSYESTIMVTGGSESARSPFTRTPATLTGLKFSD